jgi:Zn-dependent peptidase ImmA (M78 family)
MGCAICDHDFMGHCNFVGKTKAFIYIKPSMSYKQKYFTLVHEAGHLFYMKKGKIFNWAKRARSEDQANWFAVQFLKTVDIRSQEYYDFYDIAVKKLKNRRKSWFELE